MNWLTTGLGWIKTAKAFVDPIRKFIKKEGPEYEDIRMSEEGADTGFMTAQARDKFGLPQYRQPDPTSLIQKGIGRSAQGLTNIERILQPIHKLQANGYDALANVLIQKAIKDNNLVSERDLLSDTVSTSESQNIKLGKVDI